MNKITYWNYEKDIIRDTALDMRERSAINYHIKLFMNEKTFNQAVYHFRHDCLKVSEKLLGSRFSGIALDIGAGAGIFTCLLSKNKNIEKVYSLDYSKICVEELSTFVIKKFNLKLEEENKIYQIVGSFNDIKFPDNSIDLIVSMGSLHHSEDREKTLKELYRVLKTGGYLIACERASYNTKTNKDLNFLLDHEYDEETKRLMGYEPSKKYTRRMNSEHDPLLAEWEYLLGKIGFRNKIFWFLRFSNDNKFNFLHIIWNVFGKLFYKIFGMKMMKRGLTQIIHAKIPYYPWFSKTKNVDPVLIISEKMPFYEMP